VLLNFRIDTFCFKVSFKFSDSVVNFSIRFLNLVDCVLIVLLCLSQVKFKLTSLSFTLLVHVLFPVINAFLEPLLHKPGISLKFVDLYTAHFLLLEDIVVDIFAVKLGGFACLFVHLIGELLEMNFKVYFFLRPIEFCKSLLKESMGNLVVFRLRVRNPLGGLIVTKSACFRNN
jgi:hypothetical protein